jgi:hypothetical protein
MKFKKKTSSLKLLSQSQLGISLRGLCKINFGCGSHLGRRSEMPNTFWKGTIQGPFQQSLVEIGSVVSEEKIF